jgi:hypothetical protein
MNPIAERVAGRGARRRGARGLVASAIAMGVVALFPTPVRAAEEGTFSGVEDFTCVGATAADTETIQEIYGTDTMTMSATWTIKVPGGPVSGGASFPVLHELHAELPDELVMGMKKMVDATEVSLGAGSSTLLAKGDVVGSADVGFTPATVSTDDLPITFSASKVVEDSFHAVPNEAISEGLGHIVLDGYTMLLDFVGPNEGRSLDLRCVPEADVKADVTVIHQENGDGVADPADPVDHDPSFTG